KEQIKDGENGFIIENSTSKSVEDTIIKAYSLDEKEYSRLCENALSSNKAVALSEVCQELINIYKKESKHE
ncbi:MAG: hypothetical protein PF638_10755, partial [Candidatus Delongbacteria bacterium]|nr:hypothetical protein [Candidatus Delongbacteria bacterium]